MVMLIRQGNCCLLKSITRQFVTYVTEMDNKIINTNVRILCMTSVFNFDTILTKQHWQKQSPVIQGKEILKPHIERRSIDYRK